MNLPVKKIKCATQASGICLTKCTGIGISFQLPYITPSIDPKCMRTCIPNEYKECLSKVAQEISR